MPGIDISRWQCPVNWGKMVSAKPEFAAVRAAIGSIYIDPFFVDSITQFKFFKIPVTAYFVVRPDVKAPSQAAWFLSTYEIVARTGVTVDLPVVLDCEIERNSAGEPVSGKTIAQIIYDVARYMEDKLLHKPMIYSRKEWIDRLIGEKQWLNNYDWWLAWYPKLITNMTRPLPPKVVSADRVKIHQYSDRGDGLLYGALSKQIDINRWIGPETLQEYMANFTGIEPPVVIQPNLEDRVNRLEQAAWLHGWELK